MKKLHTYALSDSLAKFRKVFQSEHQQAIPKITSRCIN